MTNPTRKPGDPGHPVDLMDALHDRVHAEECLHPNPRWGPRRERVTKTKRVRRVRIAVAVDRDGDPWLAHAPDGMSAVEAMRKEWPDSARFWAGSEFSIVEADVPLPEDHAVVRGEVVDAD